MAQVIYSIFENGEPIYIENFPCETVADAEEKLNETYKNILSEEKVSNIKYDNRKLEFLNEHIETHKMIIIED